MQTNLGFISHCSLFSPNLGALEMRLVGNEAVDFPLSLLSDMIIDPLGQSAFNIALIPAMAKKSTPEGKRGTELSYHLSESASSFAPSSAHL